MTDQHTPRIEEDSRRACCAHKFQGRIHGVATAAIRKADLISTQKGEGSGCIS